MERLVGGALEVRSTNAAWMPASGLLVLKPGEEFNIDIPGYGKSKVKHIKSLEFNPRNVKQEDFCLRSRPVTPDAVRPFVRQSVTMLKNVLMMND